MITDFGPQSSHLNVVTSTEPGPLTLIVPSKLPIISALMDATPTVKTGIESLPIGVSKFFVPLSPKRVTVMLAVSLCISNSITPDSPGLSLIFVAEPIALNSARIGPDMSVNVVVEVAQTCGTNVRLAIIRMGNNVTIILLFLIISPPEFVFKIY